MPLAHYDSTCHQNTVLFLVERGSERIMRICVSGLPCCIDRGRALSIVRECLLTGSLFHTTALSIFFLCCRPCLPSPASDVLQIIRTRRSTTLLTPLTRQREREVPSKDEVDSDEGPTNFKRGVCCPCLVRAQARRHARLHPGSCLTL